MRAARFATVFLVLLATPFVAAATASEAGPPGAPKNLHGFLLRPSEGVSHVFSRTPAFAWNPVRGATCYELQLATSRSFDESTLVWSNVSPGANSGKACRAVRVTAPAAQSDPASENPVEAAPVQIVIPAIKIPAAAVNLTLPWFTGRPYALYAHVRAVTTQGATAWSRPFGFNMRWEDLPVPMTSRPGMTRWRPVEGATAYDVWYPDIRKVVRTHTNAVDQREFYIFHLDKGWWSTVRWRVRAVRQVLGAVPNGLPAVSYGPWSPMYATTNPDWAPGKLQLKVAISDEISTGSKPAGHQLMPSFTFTGDVGLDGQEYRLFRAYAFTDRDCVNVVFRGSVVGGPAFAPRVSGPLKLPVNQDELDLALVGVLPSAASEEADTFTAEGSPMTSNETAAEGDVVRVDLPDVDTRTTRYYWTVVPVGILVDANGKFVYYDVEAPQDACEAGRVSTFAKLSRPAITASGTPFVAGLTPKGRLLAVAGPRPVVYSSPLVAWRPVVGATSYEIQWSRSKYPWRARGSVETLSTSVVLRLQPGLWYYRVRGLNAAQLGTPAMAWSNIVAVKVSRPTFRVSGG